MNTSAVVNLTCLAYILLRKGIENPELRRRIGAVLGFALMGLVLVTVIIARVRADTIHPIVIGSSAGNSGIELRMSSRITTTLVVNLAIWSFLLTPTLIWWRVRLENLAIRRDQMKRAYHVG
jgi:heme exporter protein C